MIMEPPPGYPPPTLIRRRPRAASVRFAIIVLLLFAGLGFYIVSRLLDGAPTSPPPSAPVDAGPVEPGNADAAANSLPDTEQPAGPPQIVVEKPVESGTAAADPPDARKPNQWYFVPRLGDGPGAIYSRDGGQWDFAFACTTAARTIEFIAVGTGFPGEFVDQAISVGKVRVMLEAGYSKNAGGTISATLPASHPFFNSLDGTTAMEVQMVADRKTIVPVGPAVVRLVKDCRGRS